MGVLCQQYHPKGIPVQPGHGMEGTPLPGFLIVSRHKICQRTLIFRPGGMNQHPRRLVHRQQPFIFIQNRKLPVLRRILRYFFFHRHGNHISGLNGIVRPLTHTVDPDGIAPFQLVHQSGGHAQLPQQKRRQPSLPPGSHPQLQITHPLLKSRPGISSLQPER